MKVLGIGVDIVENSRFKKIIEKKSLLNRVFSDSEIIESKNKSNRASFFAKRFAAKEAFSKALGTGISRGISFNEIVILNEKNGKPFIKLLSKTKKIVEKKFKKKNYKISLSIADEKDYAVAFVTISI